MTKKINLRGIKGVPPPPQNCHLATCSIFFKKHFSKNIFQKNSKRLCWTLFEYFFRDQSITIDIVPRLKKILDFPRDVTPFR